MKLSQIRRRIEICMMDVILRYEMIKLTLCGHFYSYSYFLASTEVLSYWAVVTLEDLQSTSRGLDLGIKM